MFESGAETLKQHVLINHFTNATGCSVDQAHQLLQASRWEFEMALSCYFQESAVPHQRHPNGIGPMGAPCNTPATPPSFPDALLALQKLQASDWSAAASPPQTQPPKVLTACNHGGAFPLARFGEAGQKDAQADNSGMLGALGENNWQQPQLAFGVDSRRQ